MKNGFLYLIIGIIILLVLWKPAAIIESKIIKFMTRGLKVNNPGNIRISGTKYDGEIESSDSEFKEFTDMEHGYRAIFRLLQHYSLTGLDTIRKMISTYAPSSDNNPTDSYIAWVAKHAGIAPDDKVDISDPDLMQKIAAAISYQEQGVEPNLDEIAGGWQLTPSV